MKGAGVLAQQDVVDQKVDVAVTASANKENVAVKGAGVLVEEAVEGEGVDVGVPAVGNLPVHRVKRGAEGVVSSCLRSPSLLS